MSQCGEGIAEPHAARGKTAHTLHTNSMAHLLELRERAGLDSSMVGAGQRSRDPPASRGEERDVVRDGSWSGNGGIVVHGPGARLGLRWVGPPRRPCFAGEARVRRGRQGKGGRHLDPELCSRPRVGDWIHGRQHPSRSDPKSGAAGGASMSESSRARAWVAANGGEGRGRREITRCGS